MFVATWKPAALDDGVTGVGGTAELRWAGVLGVVNADCNGLGLACDVGARADTDEAKVVREARVDDGVGDTKGGCDTERTGASVRHGPAGV